MVYSQRGLDRQRLKGTCMGRCGMQTLEEERKSITQ